MKRAPLWPVAGALVVLIAGSSVVEFAARHREPQTLIVEIVDNELDDESLEGEGVAEPGAANEEHVFARQLAKRGDYEQALASYEKLQALAPQNPSLVAEYAHLLARASQSAKAKELLLSATVQNPRDPRLALELGAVLDGLGEVSGASEQLRRALDLRPNHSATRIALGELLRRQSKFEEAISILEPAARSGSNEERARALSALGRCWMSRGDAAKARQLLAEAIERAPASVNVWLAAANAYLDSEDATDLERALAHALQATRLAPDQALAYRLLGRIHERRHAGEDARVAYRHSLTLEPDSRVAREHVLRLSLDADDVKVAREQAQALLELAPQEAEYRFLAGLVEARDDHYDTAATFYLAAAELEQGHYPEAWFNLGKVRVQQGDTKEAITAYRKAIEEKADYAAAWNNLGRTYVDADDTVQGAECFRKALEIQPNYALAWHNLARLHYKEKRYPQAAAAYEKAVELEPGDRAVVLTYAIALRKAGEDQRAIDTYLKLLEQSPRYVAAWFNMGVAHAALGRVDEARRAYEKALELAPDHAGALTNLGYLEARSGNTAKAREYLNDALDQQPSDADTRLKLAELHLLETDLRACKSEVERVLAQNRGNVAAQAMLARCGE